MTGPSAETLGPTVIRTVEDVLALPAGSLGADARAGDVEAWDSFGHVRIVLALEAELGVRLTMAEIEGATSIAALEGALGAALERGFRGERSAATP